MNNRMIWRNFTRNKAVSLTTAVFIAAAAMLMSLAAILAVNLFGTVDQLMEEAKTPHFMQMHSGELDQTALEVFASDNDDVTDFQVLEFLNIDSAQITLGENSLAGNLQDNGFSTQSQNFDLLLDLDNQPVQPEDGELYVPVCYYKDGTAEVGDKAVINGKTFTIAGFVRDSQMNSTLASSKRFVVSEADYHELTPMGSVEYLIEFRLHDLSDLSAFETAYSNAGLASNGPTLTWPLFKMMSAISDGIMIAVIMLISILVILIALLCIRFTLLAKIEDDYREIGAMRAIGMRVSDVRSIYLTIYAVMAASGGIIGFLLSLVFQKPMQESMRLNLGSGGNEVVAMLLGAVGAMIVFLLVLLYVKWSLRSFRKISAAQAVRFGAAQESTRLGAVKLSKNRWLSTNLCLAVKDVLSRKRLYVTMLVVTMLAAFIMIVPQNLYHTIAGDEFVTYMGVGDCDLRVDVQQVDQIDKKTADIGKHMKDDQEIKQYALFTTKTFGITQDDGTVENIKIELGDHTVFPLQYTDGIMPIANNEIALSVINAEELNKKVGDQLVLLTSKGEKTLTVCGIYSDITNGGKTAKAAFTDNSAETAWSTVCASLIEPKQLTDKISEYGNEFDYAKVSSIAEYVTQTFGQTLGSVRTASLVAVLIAAVIIFLVTLLFMRLLAAKDRYSIAVMRAVGFTGSDIRRQYTWRAVLVLLIGIALGTLLAGTLGEQLSGMAISSFGAAAFHFTINPIFTYLVSPLLMLFAALTATVLGTSRAGRVHIYESIKE